MNNTGHINETPNCPLCGHWVQVGLAGHVSCMNPLCSSIPGNTEHVRNHFDVKVEEALPFETLYERSVIVLIESVNELMECIDDGEFWFDEMERESLEQVEGIIGIEYGDYSLYMNHEGEVKSNGVPITIPAMIVFTKVWASLYGENTLYNRW